MINDVQLWVIILGFLATIFPLTWACFFFTDKKGIGRVISYMLIGEAVSMAAATYFALNSYLNLYNNLDPVEVIVLRLVIFSTAFISTAKLILHLRKRQER